MKKIGVIGAGWLGMDWVKILSKKDNVYVLYTNRNSTQKVSNTENFAFNFGEEIPSCFDDLDYLFITATLPKNETKILTHFAQQLKQHLHSKCSVIFTSTISVYNDIDGIVTETSKNLNSESVYFQFEQELLILFPKKHIILRLGGLIGEDRHPVFHLSGKTIKDGQKPVNLIHKNDILKFFELIVSEKVESGIYNLVFPKHESRKEYYNRKAQEKNIELPIFSDGQGQGKIVCSKKSEAIEGFWYGCEV